LGGIIGAFAVFFTARFGRKGLLSLIGTLVYAVFLIAFGFNKNFRWTANRRRPGHDRIP